MNEKLVTVSRSWTETPASVLEEMKTKFPYLEDYFSIGEGVLSNLIHNKEAYQIGFVFPLENKEENIKQTMVYYPMKNLFVRHMCTIPYFPIISSNKKYDTKRGRMELVELKGKMVVNFSTLSRVVES